MSKSDNRSTAWWECEPRRLERDRHEIQAACPELVWDPLGAGGWRGFLPLWPFDRPEPPRLRDLIGNQGMLIRVLYGQAYPMVPPAIYPLDPRPELFEYTQTRFHVLGDGSLCLFQDNSVWTGRESVVELLQKAAGWRVEYAFVKSGVAEAMTINGIVSDDSRDCLVDQAVEANDNKEELA